MTIGERLAAAMDKVYDRMRDPASFRVVHTEAQYGTLDGLRGHKYVLLVTFRRSGEAVPSPVWAAVGDSGRLYLETAADSGKVKRVRNNSKVLVAPATVRGKPTGPVVAGSARVLSKDEWDRAEQTLASEFGFGRRMYPAMFPMSDSVRAYIEVLPEAPS